MFLWVSLIVDDLYATNQSKPKDIRRKLKELPGDIAELYARILNGIKSEDEAQAQRILQWIVYSARPLTLEELATAITVAPKHTSLEDMQEDMDLDLRRLLHTIFGSLLVIGKDGTVNLVHQSAKDFLTNTNSEQEPIQSLTVPSSSNDLHSRFGLQSNDSNTALSIACMSYLCFNVFEIELSSRTYEECLELRKKHVFLHYVAMHWPYHVNCTGHFDRVNSDLSSMFQKIAHSEKKIDFAYRIRYIHSIGFRRTMPTNSLGIAAKLGIYPLVQELLNMGADINAQVDHNGSALQVAVESGHETIVQLLVDRGAHRSPPGRSQNSGSNANF